MSGSLLPVTQCFEQSPIRESVKNAGQGFRPHGLDLLAGKTSVFLQIPVGALQAAPAVGRTVAGALLNAAYEADGQVRGRILYLLDEAARLGPMKILETARDAGRKYGITLQLLYQSVGQLERQWGREGKREWYDGVSHRSYAAVQDLDTAKVLEENVWKLHGHGHIRVVE